MKTLLRPAILVSVILAVVIQGCDDDPDPQRVVIVGEIRELPASRTKVLGRTEATGVIEIVSDNWHEVIEIEGPGSFISAIVAKKGGTSADLSRRTFVRLTLDRKEVSLKSFEVARVMGLSGQNYSGIVWFEASDSTETLVLGYSQPLHFEEVLQLGIKVDDPGVEKVLLSVTFTKRDTGRDEDTSGHDGEPEWP